MDHRARWHASEQLRREKEEQSMEVQQQAEAEFQEKAFCVLQQPIVKKFPMHTEKKGSK